MGLGLQDVSQVVGGIVHGAFHAQVVSHLDVGIISRGEELHSRPRVPLLHEHDGFDHVGFRCSTSMSGVEGIDILICKEEWTEMGHSAGVPRNPGGRACWLLP